MLNPTSRTAVAHFYNGTVVNIAKVPATPAYRALMERLGNAPAPDPSSKHDRLARWRRWWNKKRGRPATTNVGILASLLAALKDATAGTLGNDTQVDHVALTHPSMPALTHDDYLLDDALEYAGLRGWLGDSEGFQPKRVIESQAAFAGSGHGLCPSYTDMTLCWDENEELPRGLGLFVSLTRHALYASLDTMQDAFPRWQRDGPRILDFDAGLSALDDLGSKNNEENREKQGNGKRRFASEAEYWASVHMLLVHITRQRPRSEIPALQRRDQGSGPLTLLLLGGENATNSKFLDTLRDALARTSPPAWPPTIDTATMANATFVAARGMALYARRRQEVPGHCMEAPRCHEERESERESKRKRKRQSSQELEKEGRTADSEL